MITEGDIPTPPEANTPNKHSHIHTNTSQHHNCTHEIFTANRHDGYTKSSIASHMNKDTNDTHMVDNSYNVEDTRDHLLNNFINITFDREKYTAPITIKARQQKNKGPNNPAILQRDLFAKILLIDLTTKMISNNGEIFIHLKNFLSENIMQVHLLRRLSIIKIITPSKRTFAAILKHKFHTNNFFIPTTVTKQSHLYFDIIICG